MPLGHWRDSTGCVAGVRRPTSGIITRVGPSWRVGPRLENKRLHVGLLEKKDGPRSASCTRPKFDKEAWQGSLTCSQLLVPVIVGSLSERDPPRELVLAKYRPLRIIIGYQHSRIPGYQDTRSVATSARGDANEARGRGSHCFSASFDVCGRLLVRLCRFRLVWVWRSSWRCKSGEAIGKPGATW